MTVGSTYSPAKYTGNSSTLDFTYSFPIGVATYLEVYLEVISTGVQTLQTQGSDYTLVFDETGGTVSFASAPTALQYVIISRNVAFEQQVSLTTSKVFYPKVIEGALDKLTEQTQQLKEFDTRVPKLALGSTITDINMPAPVAGKAILWNATADDLINSTDDFNDIVTDATAQAVIATTQAGIATTQAGLAASARIAAQGAQTNAETAETNAETAETNAEAWASKTDGQVEATDYSSKAYAIGGTGVTSLIGSSKEWATTAEDTEVTTGLYSALHYAAKAAASATAAEVSKIEWQGSWSAGSYAERDAVEHNGSSWIATTTTTEEPSITATDWDLLALRGTDGTGSGDVSSSISSSTNNAVAVFDGVDGKTIKQGTAGTDYAKPDTKSSWTKQQSGTQYALTSTSNHIATDCDNGNNFSHTMTESTTLDNPSNIVAGTDYKWTFTQHASSAKTLALGNYFKTADGKAFVGLPTTLGAICTLIAYAETSTRLVCALNKEGANLMCLFSSMLLTAGVTKPTTIAFGSMNNVDSAAPYYPRVCYDSTNDRIVGFDSDASPADLACYVGSISGTTTTFGSKVSVNNYFSSYFDCCFDAYTGKVVVVYNISGNIVAKVGTVNPSTNSISFGSAATVFSGGSGNVYCCSAGSGKVAVNGTDSSGYNSAVIGTISGTSISFGSKYKPFGNNGQSAWPPTYDATHDKVIFAFNDGSAGKAVVGTVTGSALGFGTVATFYASACRAIRTGFDINSDNIVISFSDSSTSYIYIIAGTISGTSLNFGSATLLNNSGNYRLCPIVYDTETGVLITSSVDLATSTNKYAITTITGTIFSFGTYTGGDGFQIGSNSICVGNSNLYIYGGYDGNSKLGAKVGTLT